MDIQEVVMRAYSVPSLIVSAAVCVLMLAAVRKIFVKAGQAGWKCLIPFYNAYISVKIADGNGWKFLFLLIPLFNVVYGIMLTVRLAKSFGKSGGFALGLLFLAPVFFPILAFDGARYIAPRGRG